MQDMKVSQQVEYLIMIRDMEEKPKPQNQDVDLMPNTQQIIVQATPSLVAESTLGDEGKVIPFDDDQVIGMYNLSYNEIQKKIVQARQNHFVYDLKSFSFMREKVNVTDIIKNPNVIAATNLAFTVATKLNTDFFMAENKELEKKIHTSMQEVEKLYGEAHNETSTYFHQEEMNTTMLDEVLTLGETMQNLYEDLVTMHNVVFQVHVMQRKCKYFVKSIRNVRDAITSMH